MKSCTQIPRLLPKRSLNIVLFSRTIESNMLQKQKLYKIEIYFLLFPIDAGHIKVCAEISWKAFSLEHPTLMVDAICISHFLTYVCHHNIL